MGRTTVYNKITTDERLSMINQQNKDLMEDFLDYLESVDRSEKTIYQYSNDLNIFFLWNLDFNENKFFVDIKKRDFIKFQKHALNEYKWSPSRIKRVKSVLSSLSNYIESFLDDEFEDYRPIISKIESPVNEKVRDKTVIPDEKVELLLDTLTKERKYEQACAVAIAVYSGMRKAELMLMKVEYFNEDHLLYDGALYVTDRIRTKGRGKQGKQINKYVLVDVKPFLDRWLERRNELGIESEWLFVTQDDNGNWIKRKSMDYWTEHFSNIIDMPFYWHCLRHKLVSKMDSMNIPAEIIREFNGWSDVSLVTYYNDNNSSDSFNKYFSKDGIIKQEKGSIF